MKAMILAAGLGTRLQPLTDDRPKALVEVGGSPMLDLTIRFLMKYGIEEIIINVHHFADQLEEYVHSQNSYGISIHFSDERDMLLNTGGGIRHASWFLKGKEPFLVMAVDVLTDLNLHNMMQFHNEQQALVTLAVKDRPTTRNLLFDSDMRLSGWKNNVTGELKGITDDKGQTGLGFSGIHCIDPRIFDLIEETGAFSIVDLYLRIMQSEKIVGFRHDKDGWIEFGRAEKLPEIAASAAFKKLVALL